tara:strand:- start:156 stop:356 length:201 start_codon:yes stop_codon:yes gene_type:complete
LKILIILLLSTTGVEELKFKTQGLDCSEMAMAWADVNTTYYNMMEGNPKLQGNYTKDGKLLMAWIC